MPMEEIVHFPGERSELEGTLHYDEDVEAAGAILIASPHPTFAGNRENNVVHALAAELSGRGLVSLRFDYHGVLDEEGLPPGRSSFDYWADLEAKQDYGPAEADTRGALGFLRKVTGAAPVAIAGYSFGAAVGGMIAIQDPGIQALACIAAPVDRVDFSFLSELECPCLFVTGSGDFAASRENLARVQGLMPTPCSEFHLDPADHFFRGREADVAGAVKEFFQRNGLGASGGKTR